MVSSTLPWGLRCNRPHPTQKICAGWVSADIRAEKYTFFASIIVTEQFQKMGLSGKTQVESDQTCTASLI